jgi:hypothetical protein
MHKSMLILGALALHAAGCEKEDDTQLDALTAAAPEALPPEPAALDTTRAGGAAKKLFLDVHDVGSGKVSAKDVAGAHAKDLATQGKYGVDFKAYWLDEKNGKIYCLAEAPSAEATTSVHREAHGLLASQILEVSADNMNWAPTPGKQLYLDIHHLGAGTVTASDVARAHAKDLAFGPKHDVEYLNYWFEAASGTVVCLSEAPSAEAALAVHAEAHGLVPDSIEEVSEGR